MKNSKCFFVTSCGLFMLLFLGCRATDKKIGQWEYIFNKKDLSGWQVKISGHQLGDNFNETFGVSNGNLRVSYDKYEQFDNKFGHIFYKEKFSHFKINLDYRFIGEQVAGAPDWAFKNSGIKFHSQAPERIPIDQKLLVAVEAQILGGNGQKERPTGNVCTAGTHIEMDGKLITQHCTNSNSKTYADDSWVNLEVEVRGNGQVIHRVNGEVVLQYSKPQLDEEDEFARQLMAEGVPRMLSQGYIALQAESHPIEFRNIKIMRLAE